MESLFPIWPKKYVGVSILRIAEQLRRPLSVQRIFGRFGENILWYTLRYIILRGGENRITRN
jgi:hypothetical protein